jgi:hypothetical protein
MSLHRRLGRLEGRIGGEAAEEERHQRIRRTLTRLIVAEHARIRASGEGNPGDLEEKACLAVAHDQYDHLGPEHRDELGRGWAEEMRGWSKLDWATTIGHLGPPPGFAREGVEDLSGQHPFF